MAQVQISVSGQIDGKLIDFTVSLAATQTVGALLGLVLERCRTLGIHVDGRDWALRGPHGNLRGEQTVEDALAGGPLAVELVALAPPPGAVGKPQARYGAPGPASTAPVPTAAPSAPPPSTESRARDESGDDFDLALDDSEFELTGPTVQEDSASQVVALDEDADSVTVSAPDDSHEVEVAAAPRKKKAAKTLSKKAARHATVRYYERMNPRRMFPLLVTISREQIQDIVKKEVAQRRSQQFEAALDVEVEIEPILPGCDCYPPVRRLNIAPAQAVAEFWVVPQVLGRIMKPCVLVRQQGKELANIPLDMRVTNRTLAVFMGVLTLILPLLSALMKHYRLDFASQVQDGFSIYAQILQFVAGSLSAELLGLILLLLTLGAYWLMRPLQRDVFWDLETISSDQQFARALTLIKSGKKEEGLAAVRELLRTNPEFPRAWFFVGHAHFLRQEYAESLEHYRRGHAAGKGTAKEYARAALAASRCGNNELAFELMDKATRDLPTDQITGVMWYNLACYATRLHKFDDALGFLDIAVRRGYTKSRQYRDDPDLAPLRQRPEFQAILTRLADTVIPSA